MQYFSGAITIFPIFFSPFFPKVKCFIITDDHVVQVSWKRWNFLSIFLRVASNFNHCSRRWKIHEDSITCWTEQVAVFPTRKSQLCVCVSFIIKVCKKEKAFTYSDDSFLMYKLNRFSKTPLSLIYCGISRAACPNIANVIFLALKKIAISTTLLKSNHHLIAAYGCC